MSASSLFVRLRNSRRTSLLLFAITLGTLVVAAIWFGNARSALASAYQNLGSRNQVLAEVRVREQEAQLRVDYAESARQLLEAAEQHGLSPQTWGERLINLRQSQVTREEALPLLATVLRSNDRMFGADAFELSVTHPEEGLFDPPISADRKPAPVSLSLRGSLLFQTESAPDLLTPQPATIP